MSIKTGIRIINYIFLTNPQERNDVNSYNKFLILLNRTKKTEAS